MSDESNQAPENTGQTEPTPGSAPGEYRAGATNPARRRWLRAGLAAPPVLMTVASRPVLGATAFCVPPSAYVSLPTSTPGMYDTCNGQGPTGWIGTNPWPSPYCREGTQGGCGPGGPSKFNDFFNPDLGQGAGPSLLTVLSGGNEVAKYVVAALLNYAAGLVPSTVLPESTIKHIWTEFAATASFSPMPSASWNQLEIVDYLKSTMTSA